MVEEKMTKGFGRYTFIDALRGWAIILVLVAHVSIVGTIHYPSWLLHITYLYVGPRGVQLFFVVSAVTLYMSWTKRENKEKHVVENFYIRRFFRIAPLFYLSIIYFLFIQSYWNGNPNHFSMLNILSTFLFVNGAVPAWMNNIVYGGWSIAVEMVFYLFFPFIVSTLRSIRKAVIVAFIAMILAQLLRLWLNTIPLFSQTYSTYTFEFFPSQFPVFLVGIVTFLLLKNQTLQKDRKFLAYFFGFFISILLVQFVSRIPIIAGHYFYGIFFGGIAYFLAKKPIRLFVNALTIHIGKVSYSIYLTHVAILWIMEKLHILDFFPQYPLLNFFLVFLLLLFISTIVATVLFYIVERPGQLLGKKLIDHYEKTSTNDINMALKTW